MIRLNRTGRIVSIATVALLFCACDGATPTSNTPTPTSVAPAPAPSLTAFEEDLRYIRNGGFTYIWLFSRKDGKPLEPSDSDFLRKNAPQVVDWIKTDEGRKIFAGTNFNLEEGNLEELKKRFVAEDYTGK